MKTKRFHSVNLTVLGYSVVLLAGMLTSAEAGCRTALKSDGDCNMFNNNLDCEYDGGDCCEGTCVSTNLYGRVCGERSGFNCIDENNQCDTDTIGDGICNAGNNSNDCENAEGENYDGGDCCEGTCDNTQPQHTCDTLEASDCIDPVNQCDESTMGDGKCDHNNNSAACVNADGDAYDGGDCCESTCEHGDEHVCGPYKCIDPEHRCDPDTIGGGICDTKKTSAKSGEPGGDRGNYRYDGHHSNGGGTNIHETCSDFSESKCTSKSRVLKDNPESITCKRSRCWLSDCCEQPQPTCADFPKERCTRKSLVLKENPESVKCSGAKCWHSDCCEESPTLTCSDFPQKLCTRKSLVLKDSPESVKCSGAKCWHSDCCEESPTLTCSDFPEKRCTRKSLVLKDSPESVKCSGAKCWHSDCCEQPQPTCSDFPEERCTRKSLVLKDSPESVKCSGAKCWHSDCCEESPTLTCSDFPEERCTRKSLVLKDNPESVKCSGAKCWRSDCCEESPTPTCSDFPEERCTRKSLVLKDIPESVKCNGANCRVLDCCEPLASVLTCGDIIPPVDCPSTDVFNPDTLCDGCDTETVCCDQKCSASQFGDGGCRSGDYFGDDVTCDSRCEESDCCRPTCRSKFGKNGRRFGGCGSDVFTPTTVCDVECVASTCCETPPVETCAMAYPDGCPGSLSPTDTVNCLSGDCDESECCVEEIVLGICPECGTGEVSTEVTVCATETCGPDECCEPVFTCETVTCTAGMVPIGIGVQCTGNPCTESLCCEAPQTCSGLEICAHSSLLKDGETCSTCDASECCSDADTCDASNCASGEIELDPSKSGNICTGIICLESECCKDVVVSPTHPCTQNLGGCAGDCGNDCEDICTTASIAFTGRSQCNNGDETTEERDACRLSSGNQGEKCCRCYPSKEKNTSPDRRNLRTDRVLV